MRARCVARAVVRSRASFGRMTRPLNVGYKRISLFEKKGADKTVRVCYRGGVHYDALVV